MRLTNLFLKLTERKLIFACFLRLTRPTNATLEAHWNKNSFLLVFRDSRDSQTELLKLRETKLIFAYFLRLTRLTNIALLKLTETKLIFSSFWRLTRLTNVILEAHRKEAHFCLFCDTHKAHKGNSWSSEKRNSFLLVFWDSQNSQTELLKLTETTQF